MSVPSHRFGLGFEFGFNEADRVALTARGAIDRQQIVGTVGDDHIRGSDGDDYIDVSQGGRDVVHSRFGNDTIYFGASFTGGDRVDGGGGHHHGHEFQYDVVVLDGDYSAGIAMTLKTLHDIDRLTLEGGSYRITGEFRFGLYGQSFIDGSGLTADQHLTIDATSPSAAIWGGMGDDSITMHGDSTFLLGGEGDDILVGDGHGVGYDPGMGADTISMSSGSDRIYYDATSESVHGAHDLITHFAGRISFYFDSDETIEGRQNDFHFGPTAGRVGDIVVHYNSNLDETIVNVFTNPDTKVDLTIHLSGDVPLTIQDFVFN